MLSTFKYLQIRFQLDFVVCKHIDVFIWSVFFRGKSKITNIWFSFWYFYDIDLIFLAIFNYFQVFIVFLRGLVCFFLWLSVIAILNVIKLEKYYILRFTFRKDNIRSTCFLQHFPGFSKMKPLKWSLDDITCFR